MIELDISEFMQPHEVVSLMSCYDRDALEGRSQELWYSVYVDELGLKPGLADHARKRLADPHLRSGGAFLALNGDREVVGTIIWVVGDSLGDADRPVYGIPRQSSGQSAMSLGTKFVVRNGWRQKTSLSLDLYRAAYRWGLQNKIRFNYCGSPEYAQTFHERLGYRPHSDQVTDPERGQLVPMVLDLEDYQHLNRVRSPFAPLHAELRRPSTA